MYAIALKMLFGDRGKYIAMIVGITFASLIMTQQPSILVGLLSRTYSFVGDVGLPDIWVMDPGVQFVEEHKPLRDVDLSRVRGVAGVEWAAPMFKNIVQAKLPDGNTKSLDLTGLDDATLIGAPSRILEGSLLDLRRADAVLVSEEAANTQLRVRIDHGVKFNPMRPISEENTRPLAVGDVIEINDKRAVVAGLIKTTRNFVLQPQVYTTYSRAVSYAPPNRRQLTYVLVKAKPGTDIAALTQRISEQTGLAAYTNEAFKQRNLDYWMKNTGIPINFGISVFLGFIVGAAIVGQTFATFVNENIKQYAALKSMGLRNGVLARMVVLQAAVVGIIGYGIGVGFTTLFGMQFHDSVLAFRMPPILLVFAGGGVLAIVTIAALFAVRRVIKIDPAVVFRT
jgi:putative ABC transport system permease protein